MKILFHHTLRGFLSVNSMETSWDLANLQVTGRPLSQQDGANLGVQLTVLGLIGGLEL